MVGGVTERSTATLRGAVSIPALSKYLYDIHFVVPCLAICKRTYRNYSKSGGQKFKKKNSIPSSYSGHIVFAERVTNPSIHPFTHTFTCFISSKIR